VFGDEQNQFGVCHFMTDKKLESISALLDDELNQSEFDESLANEIEQFDSKSKFSRYSLIGDVMRNEQHVMVDDSFASSIQAAIADLDTKQPQASVTSITSHPSWVQRVKQTFSGSAGKAMGQFAIAASVALVAIVGVNNMEAVDGKSTTPVISTSPLINGVAPVSVASDQQGNKPSANQMTQYRIDALIADHQQQLKVKGDGSEKDEDVKEDDK
jgi:sigma-E factor negative regulatory protein RseA